MEVKNIIICDDVINQPGPNGQVPNLISPYANIVLPVLPTTYSFSVFVIIDGAPDAPGRFDINFYHGKTPQDIMNNVAIDLDASMHTQMTAKTPSGINFSINMRNILFKETGKYIIDVFFNGEKISSQSIDFYKAEAII